MFPSSGSRDQAYYEIHRHETLSISEPGVVQRFEFEMSLDVIQNNREVYTVMDMLGDIGGLLDFILIVVKAVFSIVLTISGSELMTNLTNKLFFHYERDMVQLDKSNGLLKLASHTIK